MAASSLPRHSARLARLLAATELRLVLAESCTCGLIAAALGETPGISRWLCGSAVVYQEATKTAWLGVPDELIRRRGVVSRDVAREMACGALRRTPHAEVAASITGHLGPAAPKRLDGVVHAAVAFRAPAGDVSSVAEFDVLAWRRRLEESGGTPRAVRLRRRRAAAAWVIELLHDAIADRFARRL